jgi:hypothetical protein
MKGVDMAAKETRTKVDWNAPLTEKEKNLAARVRAANEESRKGLEHMTFPCPVDGKMGTYSRDIGTYQMVVPVFKCPDGHEFSVRLDLNNATKLLPAQGSTPPNVK